jgi:ubiquinone biosynthesis protein
MDASRISMGRLLSFLFEVTETFGMETRTELILLQRTMVVVEGVARTLNPNMNIWQVAQPVVEDYIRESLGPRAFARDLFKTARVLARFGPQLPAITERLFASQTQDQPETTTGQSVGSVAWFAIGVATASIGGVIGAVLF